MRKQNVVVDGVKKEVYAALIGAELWVHIDGETRLLDMRPKKKSTGTGGAGSSNEIHSPMPGRILKVNHKVGELVKERQVLVVMEAMKMEYSLESPCAGVVEFVKCSEGQQVELGQLLVRLKPSEKK